MVIELLDKVKNELLCPINNVKRLIIKNF